MSVTHSGSALAAATDAVTALLGANSKLVFRLTGTLAAPGTAVATCLMETSTAPFNAANGTTGIAAAKAISSDTNATGNASPVANASLQTSADVLIVHCDVGAQVSTSITGSSAAATVTVGSAAGLIVGNKVSGTGIGTGARIVNINGTTVTLSVNNSGAVSGTGTFDYDINMSNGLVVAAADTVSVSSLTYQAITA